MRTRIVVISLAIALALPFSTSAASLAELQTQLAALMTQITALQGSQQTSTSVTSPASCPNLTRNLSRGMKGADVTSLQQFLISQKLLAADNATGFFGALTEKAVQQWQCTNMNICSGSPSSNGYGAVGPKTRSLINQCSSAATTSNMPSATGSAGTSVGGTSSVNSATANANTTAMTVGAASTSTSAQPLTSLNDANIYVSPQGSDAGLGTLASPYRTVERAQQRVREIRASVQGNITVYLRGGTYQLTRTLVFGQTDGGANDRRVTYTSYNNEQVILSGGTPLSIWTPIGGGIYQTSAQGLAFRQLYAPGQAARTERARFPDTGDNGYYRVTEYRLTTGNCSASIYPTRTENKKLTSLHLEPADFSTPPAIIAALPGAEAVILKSFDQSRLFTDRVTFGVNGSAEWYPTVSSAQAEGCNLPWLQLLPTHQIGYRMYFENRLAFINRPGEWALENGLVYYMPRTSSELTGMVAPRLEKLVVINGASNLTFSGLTFEHANSNQSLNSEYIGGAAGFNGRCLSYFSDSCMVPGGIEIVSGTGITIERSKIARFGASGVIVKGGTSNITIRDNLIEDMAGGGIIVPTFFPQYGVPTLSTDQLRIEHNLIQGTGLDYDVPAIFVAHTSNSSISNNTVRFASYIGVHLGWFFGEQQQPIPPKSNSVVNNNDISDVMLTYHDGGGIYTLNGLNGVTVSGNYIHDFREIKSPYYWTYVHMGVYLDLLTDGLKVLNTLVKNVSQGFYVQIEPGGIARNNTITGMHLVNVDEHIPSGYDAAVRAKALEPAVNNVIQDDSIDQPQIASQAGISASVKSLWGTALVRSGTDFFPAGVRNSILTPTITATAPNVGQSVTAGAPITISWQSTNAPAGSAVSLFAVNDANGAVIPIDIVPVSGSLTWTVPSDTSAGAGYYIQVNLYKSGDSNTVYATTKSGVFTVLAKAPIGPPSLAVTAPVSGQSIAVGSNLAISWQSSNAPIGSAVSLWAVNDTNGAVIPIDIVETTGTYSWKVPVGTATGSGYYLQVNLYKSGDPSTVYNTTKSQTFTVI